MDQIAHFVKSEDLLADILTKAISSKAFHNSLDQLGIGNIYAPTWGGVLSWLVDINLLSLHTNNSYYNCNWFTLIPDFLLQIDLGIYYLLAHSGFVVL